MTTDTLIENQISLLGPEYRAFVESSFIEEVARSFGEELAFNQRQVEILENALFLFLTLIFSDEETKEFIVRNCDLPPSETELLWAAIESSLPEGMLSLITQARNTLTQLSEAQPVATPTTPVNLTHEIAEMEQELASTQGIRTMAGDMRAHSPAPTPTPDSEPIYRSTQSDILPSQPPRWETG